MNTENTTPTADSGRLPDAARYAVKPPLGPEPEWLWREKRMWHLLERLAGYANQTAHPPQEAWLSELRTRIDEVLRHNATSAGDRDNNQPHETDANSTI